MTPIATFLWRRLDQPGHDCCRLLRDDAGWRLAGTAVFREGRRNCQLRYEVITDRRWRTLRAQVTGLVGNRTVAVDLVATAAGWSLGGRVHRQLPPGLDVDLGFTPATNLIPLRRLRLAIGQRAEAPAAYLEFPRLRLVRLPQTYRRLDRTRYDYRAPTTGYRGILRVSRLGAVIAYPRLFALVEQE